MPTLISHLFFLHFEEHNLICSRILQMDDEEFQSHPFELLVQLGRSCRSCEHHCYNTGRSSVVQAYRCCCRVE